MRALLATTARHFSSSERSRQRSMRLVLRAELPHRPGGLVAGPEESQLVAVLPEVTSYWGACRPRGTSRLPPR
jgi:hypothetical protein